ncbi:MAG: D-alanyl-D-alanine carboxypeptidase [Henriciella sp.]|jgi:D-alanyl-D-alanine carboxypeptidase (penicillin-binding protein 5/6)|uniref:D-alanyl-D-alanine carboxypeptidase family protein n=1 Tax=Henriciella sp. TaxID=1968823 RepID=UPI000C0E6DA4|nr:D-alanyl-D-alanine carboxypeptidase family protein [Henriciella sp.]MAN75525.1 D-alanyl-D-alanine carboxypeptidase [Henriciella sp.]MBF34000.1 D-alanyl-D-alanine carboxypeptidase [Hyphomonadaceae bacterium]PHR76464.1 MAG: D-alanyl-D-alanine carboxypeptidase [Henriciella sp.]|tara:strand:+ start:25 stop:1182 length:1158 start_codon:yes stop_codon:yes gene_type:complete
MRRPTLLAAVLFIVGAVLPASAQYIDTQAEYAVIMDYETGDILYSKRGSEPMIPASMTKIMTAHVIYDAIESGEISLDDEMVVSERAWREGGWATGGSTMGLKIGETPTVEQLLRGVVVLSGNDACIVLAEGLSGSEDAFADRMTDLAHELGLESANFKNASGLPAEGHVISAIDLAKLAAAEIRNYPQYYKYYSELEMTWNGITQGNRNPLLYTMEGADGLKTGHLQASGYGLTASAERDGQRMIMVLNGLPSSQARAEESERLMRIAFTAFDSRTISPGAEPLAQLPVWNGESRTVGVQLASDVRVAGHKQSFDEAKSEIVYNGPIAAPIKAGDEIATLVITMDGKDVPVTAPLVATESVGALGFVGRAIEGLSLKMGGGTAE